MSTPSLAHHDRGPRSALEAVLVDMDGTLVDTERLWYLGEIDTMAALGSEWTEADQAWALGGPQMRVAQYMVDKAGSALSASVVSDRLTANVLRHFVDGDVSFTPGTEDLLDGLQAAGIPMALVSSSPRQFIDVVLERLGTEHFSTTIAGDEAPHQKPHPAPYLMAAERLGARIHRCAILEDSPTGVAAGLASGGLVVAIPHMVPIEPGERLVVVSSLAEVTPAHLEEWLATHPGA